LFNEVLKGEKVERIMNRDIIAVSPEISVNELVENFIYRYHHKMFPVVSDGRLVGAVTTVQVRDVPRAEWSTKTAGELAKSNPSGSIIEPDMDVMEALSFMNRTGLTRLIVSEDGKLSGIITSKDIMRVISLRLELKP
jgi:predicted transcriptional regulator